jgi:transposase
LSVYGGGAGGLGGAVIGGGVGVEGWWAVSVNFSSVRRIFVARDSQDMRRGIDMLSSVVEHQLGHEPFSGDCFVFVSRDRRKLKVLIWEDGGFWLCLKRLSCGSFASVDSWCVDGALSVAVSPARIHALIEGIDMQKFRYRLRSRVSGCGGDRRFLKCGRERYDQHGRGRADGGRGGSQRG